MRAAVRMIDTILRLHGRMFEFSQDPDCVLRLQFQTAPHSTTIDNQTIHKGDPLLAIHFWNERIPELPSTGPDLAWALQLRRRIICSFREVAQLMYSDPRFADVCAIFGISSLFSFTDHTGGVQMAKHLGFTVLPCYRPFGRFGEFWENLFSWWMMWAYNDVSLHSRKFWRLQRTEIWMTRDQFLHRYGLKEPNK